MTSTDRFEMACRVSRLIVDARSEDECWRWSGSAGLKGYGSIVIHGRTWKSHRAAYVAFVGPIPNGFVIDYLCRNVWCVNPRHLEAVSDAENRFRQATATRARSVCRNGHEFTPENTRVTNSGKRACRACTAAAMRRYEQKLRDRKNTAAQTCDGVEVRTQVTLIARTA